MTRQLRNEAALLRSQATGVNVFTQTALWKWPGNSVSQEAGPDNPGLVLVTDQRPTDSCWFGLLRLFD